MSEVRSSRFPAIQIAAAATVVALGIIFSNTFTYLWSMWQREEYSHGFLVPLISLYLIWQRRQAVLRLPFTGSWWGVALLALGLFVYVIGSIASITTIDTYALVIVTLGAVLALTGWRAFKLMLGPLMLLFLMNPIPAFLFNSLSSTLQLLSSQIGVSVIHLLGISAHLEGNVIDLGSYQLQVVEACSGLRYLFPLLTLGFVVVSLVPTKLWIRAVLVLSTIPITVLMNSFRIGVIGALVDRIGISQAEGFLHDFEGWIIFMSCFALLLLETLVLLRLTGDRRDFRSLLGGSAVIGAEETAPSSSTIRPGPQPIAALALLLLALWPALSISARVEIRPIRSDLTTFPVTLAGREGRRERIEAMYLDQLKLDDYLMANYSRAGEPPINFYVAYYASQRTGQAAHSPSSCLPGSGWRINEFDQRVVPGASVSGHPLRVNRALIQLGDQRQLVYYWFQQRGRVITNEYLVKWYLLLDALRLNRSDGALVRIITPLVTGEDVGGAEARLSGFARAAAPALNAYVPD